jgi:membrane protease YdiL (CAAX protease family)
VASPFDHRRPVETARLTPSVGFVLGFFLLLALLSLFIGAPAQLAGVGPGLLFTEVFVFLAPTVVLAHALGMPARVLTRAGPVPWRLVVVAGLIGLVNYPLAVALEGAMHQLMPNLAQRFDTGAILAGVTGPARVILVLAVGLSAPLGEETAFRGGIQRLLRPRLGDGRAVLLTAVLFAAIHFDPVGFLGRVELGVLFGLMALWSGSLWVGMAAHAANNLVAMAIYYGVGGRSDDALPGALQLLGLAAVGAALTAPLLLLLHRWTRGSESPAELPELRPTGIRGELGLWLAAMAMAFLVLVAGDRRGFHLAWTDATTPYQQGFPEGAKRGEVDHELRELRREAAAGSISIERYDAFRRWLFSTAQGHQLDAGEIEARIGALRATGP